MNNVKGYNQYKEQSVTTMTNIEMLITLYDEAIKRLNRAKLANDNERFDLHENEIERAKDIIAYLDQTLDRQYPISVNLHSLYEFMTFEITRAKISRKNDIIDEIIPMLSELRESFIQANKIASKQ